MQTLMHWTPLIYSAGLQDYVTALQLLAASARVSCFWRCLSSCHGECQAYMLLCKRQCVAKSACQWLVQAGSDSLLTASTFLKLKEAFFSSLEAVAKHQGILYGLSHDDLNIST